MFCGEVLAGYNILRGYSYLLELFLALSNILSLSTVTKGVVKNVVTCARENGVTNNFIFMFMSAYLSLSARPRSLAARDQTILLWYHTLVS